MKIMRTKDDIIDSIGIVKGAETKLVKLKMELCRLEVLVDIRDLLELLVYPKYKVDPEGKVEKLDE